METDFSSGILLLGVVVFRWVFLGIQAALASVASSPSQSAARGLGDLFQFVRTEATGPTTGLFFVFCITGICS